MNTGNWNIVKEVFNHALELPEDQRDKYLQDACGANTELLRDVSGLLDSFDSEFMERPAIAEVAEFIVGDEDKLAAGDRLNHYRIVKLLGSGGMGEVYLAEDTKLNRQVAVKLLPPLSVTDPEANRRFLIEAQTAAELDHPHICTVHEIGESDERAYIVMQYIKGETLAERIRRQPLTIREALDFAAQIADALAEAHSRGIVHRDIKPSNVIINPRGQAKVLDFSLARKTFLNSDDTTQIGLSTPGMIVGTVSYMSPEQARGKHLDARTDIWSLGVVLYEMLTGKLPFKGETSSDTIAAILKSELPPLEQTGREFPVELSSIVKKALEKDPDKRYQSVLEMHSDIERIESVRDAGAAAYDADTVAESASTRQQRYPFTGQEALADTASNTARHEKSKTHGFPSFGFGKWAMAASLLLAVGIPGAVIWYKSAQKPAGFPTNLVRTEITSWKNDLGFHNPGRPRFSPDGKLIAFASTRGGKQAIWLKQLDGGEPFTRKEEGDNSIDTDPIFSPDGQQIAFISNTDGKNGIWTMPVLGGTRNLLIDFGSLSPNLISYSRNGQKLYYHLKSNLYLLDMPSKSINQITNFDSGLKMQRNFSVSPDEEQIAYADRADGQRDIWLFSVANKTTQKITNDTEPDSSPIWQSNDSIIYNSTRNNISQIYGASVSGDLPTQISLGDISSDLSDVLPKENKILYQASRDDADIWQVDLETGKESVISGEIDAEIWSNSSPENNRIAYQTFPSYSRSKIFNSEIWIKFLDRKNKLLITKDGFLPQWSPLNDKIAFLKMSDGLFSIWTVPSSGGDAQQITNSGVVFGGFSMLPLNPSQSHDYAWSSDGQKIIYSAKRDGVINIWQANADGSGEKQISDNKEADWFFYSPITTSSTNKIAWLGQFNPKGNQGAVKWAIWLSENGQTKRVYESENIMALLGWAESENDLIVKSVRGKNRMSSSEMVDASIVSINTKTLRISTYSELKTTYFFNIRVSPDKKHIAYVTRQGGTDDLHVIPTNGGQSRSVITISDPLVYTSALAWSHDGKSIFYSKHANWSIISMLETPK